MAPRILVLVFGLLPVLQADFASTADRETDCRSARLSPVDTLVDVYEPAFAMRFAVPQGWRRIELPRARGSAVQFSVAYESRFTDVDDDFADYVMIELVEGSDGAGFIAHADDERESRRIDGHPAVLETLRISDYPVAAGRVDLFVQQAGLVGPGYHLGLYAIGQCGEEPTLRQAFAVLIETFRLERRPFGAF